MRDGQEPKRPMVPWGFVFGPTLSFGTMFLVVVLLQRWSPVAVVVVYMFLFLIIWAPMVFVGSARARKLPFFALGLLNTLASFAGIIAGLVAYHRYVLPYASFEDHRMYSNVLTSEPPRSHADAGVLEFAKSCHVDGSKGVGMLREAGTFCAAPIVDDAAPGRVEYWAVGLDCCSPRGDFTCGDVEDKDARQGAVIRPEEPSWTDYFVPGEDSYEMYHKAVKQSAAIYDVHTSDSPMMVHWVKDVRELEHTLALGALLFGLLSTVAVLFLMIPVAVTVDRATTRQLGAEK
mmetsp:Transcript_59649/g.159610  ORF Transcript_59649/g.159610 Transcript_59649/m.159610 type:complete len:290 (-) Transcript_59649:187-1056(-)